MNKKHNKSKVAFLALLLIFVLGVSIFRLPKDISVNNATMDEYQRTLNLKYALDYAVPNEGITWKEGKGTGSLEDPIQISDIDDFNDFLNIIKSGKRFTGMYIVLTNDIEFPEGHDPIVPCITNNYFAGCFDGQGHVFKNLQIEYKGTSITSLFGRGSGCVIKNVGFDGGEMRINTSADGTGLLIINMSSNSLIYNVYSTMDLYAESTNTNFWPNGFVLYMSDNGRGNIGYVVNSYFGGNIYSNSKTWSAGLARVSNAIDDIDMFNSFTATTSEGVDYNYNSTDGVSAMEDDGYGCKYDSRIDITSQETVDKFNDFILYNVGNGIGWKLSDDGTHMVFDLDNTFSPDDFFEGDGSEENPYLIQSNQDLKRFRSFVQANTFEGKYLKLTRDLDFTGEEIQKVLPNDSYFYGTFDGNGHVVKNFEMQGSQGAFFGRVFGTIKNFGLEGGVCHATGSPEWMATFVRGLDGGKLLNCFSSMDFEAGDVIMQRAVSGLVAYVETAGGEIRNCYYAGNFDRDLYNKKEESSYIGEYPYGISYTSNANLRLENTYYKSGNIYAAFGRKDASIKNESFHEVTEEYMKTEDFVNDLNEYSLQNNGFFTWKENEDGYPLLDAMVIKGEIANLSVDGTTNDNTVDSIKWYLENTSGEYYMFLPGFLDRENLDLNIEYAKDTDVTVKAITDEGEIDLGTVEDGISTDIFKYNKLVFTSCGDNVDEASYTVNVMQSSIGSIHITLDGSETGKTPEQAFKAINNDSNHNTGFPGTVVILDNENNTVTEVEMTGMKGRGNSSWKRIKKPYQLKFGSKVSMLGMEKAKKWLLITNYEDGSLSRNFAFFEYAKQLGFEYGIDYAPIDVYVNNVYHGSYWVTDKVEVSSSVVDIEDTDYLLEIDNYVDDYQVRISGDDLITIKNPDLEKYENQEEVDAVLLDVQTKLNHLVEMFEDTSYSLEEINEYIDVESLAKMYWVQELSENIDAMRGSVYMYSKDGKFYMGPVWDMDYTLNRQYNWANLKEYFILDNKTQRAKDYYVNWYDGLLQRQEFSDLLDKVFLDNLEYAQNGWFDSLDAYFNKIKASANMNAVVWPYASMGNANNVGTNFGTGSKIFRNNLKTRVDFYAEEYKDLKLNKVQYTYTDKKGNVVTDEYVIEDNSINIVLPATADLTKDVSVVGCLPNDRTRDVILVAEDEKVENATLEEGKFEGTLRVENVVTKSAIKKVNSNVYTLNITAEDVELSDVKVTKLPEKLEYYAGDEVNLTGLEITATYNDGTEEIVEDYEVLTNEIDEDTKAIEIRVGDKVISINIEVIPGDVEAVVEGIEVTQLPDKVNYRSLECIDTTGLIVSKIMSDGTKVEIEDYEVDLSCRLLKEHNKVTITYENFTTSYDITVTPRLKGDMDDNGVLNVIDSGIVMDLFKFGNETEFDLYIGDMNNDGVLNVEDAGKILDCFKYEEFYYL